MEQYYVYWDQGGLLGKGVILITKEPIAVEEGIEHHISWYYYGKLTAIGLCSLIFTYNQMYGELPNNHKDSEFSVGLFNVGGM